MLFFGKIERLAELHAKGHVSDEEFRAQKAELLASLKAERGTRTPVALRVANIRWNYLSSGTG